VKRKEGALHVAKIIRRHGDKTYRSFLLRRSYREGGKVKHQTLGNISHLPDHIVAVVQGALQGKTYALATDLFQIVRSLPHGHVAAVLGTLRKIGLDQIIDSRPSRERDLVVAMIVARLIDPRSKLATVRGFREATAFSTLGECLGIQSADEDDLYEAMDWLLDRQARIENKLAKRHLQEGVLLLYDVSGSYYTGTHCPLVAFGHPRDGRKDFPQIVYGLLCTKEGCPISVHVFKGNTSDPTTLKVQIQTIRQRFRISRVIFVADRGVLREARIEADIRSIEGFDWITALRAPAIRVLAEQGAFQMSLFDQQDLAEIRSPDYPDERLIVCRNPLLAEERARKREELLRATEKKLDQIVAATQREKRPLRGSASIALRVGRDIGKRKVEKHFKVTITDTTFSYERITEKIAAEAALDGIYVIRTSVKSDVLDADHTVDAYKGLSGVERAFRCMKTIDLKVRPIHHRRPHRVRAHVFMCMLGYYVEWHMRQALAPILFDDEDKELAKTLRESVVSPAKRSPKAEEKAQTKLNDRGEPVHSFRTLLQDLSTLTKNRVRIVGSAEGAEFDQVPELSPLQQRAFELLGVPLNC